MESIRGMGNVVGDYVGDGQGDSEHATQAIVSADLNSVDADGGVVEDQSLDDEEDISNNAEPLLFVYDCETTGLSVYDDHITDIAAMVVASPMPLSAPTFSSLVRHPNAFQQLVCMTHNTYIHTNLFVCVCVCALSNQSYRNKYCHAMK